MLTLNLIQTILKRFQTSEEKIKSRLRDFNDATIEKALLRTYSSFDDLAFFLAEFQESDEVIAHLLGFDNAKYMEQCYTKFEFEQNQIRKEFDNEN